MRRRPPRSTRTDTLFPSTTRFRSMPNAVIGFDARGRWMDQGVDARSMDSSAVQGVDGWGSSCVGLGNLLLSEAEDAESRFPIINISREMTVDSGGAGDRKSTRLNSSH